MWELNNSNQETLDDQEGVSKRVYKRINVQVPKVKLDYPRVSNT